jgi:hypothetical protein
LRIQVAKSRPSNSPARTKADLSFSVQVTSIDALFRSEAFFSGLPPTGFVSGVFFVGMAYLIASNRKVIK